MCRNQQAADCPDRLIPQEMDMSLFSKFAAGRQAFTERQTALMLDSLPAEIQRDIGWAPRGATSVSTAFGSPFWSVKR